MIAEHGGLMRPLGRSFGPHSRAEEDARHAVDGKIRSASGETCLVGWEIARALRSTVRPG
jgi:hypothetical protein